MEQLARHTAIAATALRGSRDEPAARARAWVGRAALGARARVERATPRYGGPRRGTAGHAAVRRATPRYGGPRSGGPRSGARARAGSRAPYRFSRCRGTS
ncbi:hypothetical protein GCM10010126_30160 [Planomonospora parontospora]|uniref:Uncharacterized protein n=1 Tax=Planomonospora parontospora TaxID=58119 RepID=A0AA37BGZ3_9ACTN|nr:hypothetical protein GCM10010126_30160 [Planomonospora parontospora]